MGREYLLYSWGAVRLRTGNIGDIRLREIFCSGGGGGGNSKEDCVNHSILPDSL